jgi:hypothetical protein
MQSRKTLHASQTPQTMTPQKQVDESTYAGRFAANLQRLRTKANMTGKETAAAIEKNGFPIQWRTYYSWDPGAARTATGRINRQNRLKFGESN